MKHIAEILRLVVVAALAASVSVAFPRHAPAEARAIRWNQVIGADASQLDAAGRERAAALMRSEFCYFGCSRSIARCLEAGNPSRTARRLAGYVVRQVLAGRTDDQIREGIRDRGLSAHPLQTTTVNLSGVQCVGPANAPVTVAEFADFECPFCRIISPILHRLVEELNPSLRLCFKHFPVRGHRRALPASIAALAAARQGRFWQMHDALYASSPRLDDDDLEAAARQAGVGDLARWNQDRQDSTLQQLVEADKLEGLRIGVAGTPSIFINNKEYRGQKNEAELRDRLEEELDIINNRR